LYGARGLGLLLLSDIGANGFGLPFDCFGGHVQTSE
jgi:hypothetical protein